MFRPSLREHTDAIEEAITNALATWSIPVGVGKAPTDAEVPYVTIYPITGGQALGTLGEPYADAELIYQLTCTGESVDQVEWLVDKASAIFDGLVVDGRYIPVVEPEDGGPGVLRDDDQTPPVFYSPFRIRITTILDDAS